ncbi:hypothetical protein KKC06_01290 [Patescibacteria group bacterium]|nr:hypothetical protein [Patescibacteria group bacterium]
MKKLLIIIVLIASAVIVSGCDKKTGTSKTDGGVYKSSDFGENWNQKVFVSEGENGAQTISNVDTNFMVFDPKNKNIMYLVTLGAGIFKSDNAAEKWQATTLNTGTYKSLAIDLLNTNVIYVTEGTKISKTVDGMKTWFDTYIEKRPGQTLISVLVDPFNSNIIYAATNTEIIKSQDYGNSWTLLDWTEPTISQIYISKKNSSVLFAHTSAGIHKSVNGGLDWIRVSDKLKEFDEGSLTFLWVNFDPHTEYFIIGTSAGIFRSLDGGSSWKEIPTLFDFKKVPVRTVVYNPKNLNQIIFSIDNILYKTQDDGRTWTTLKTVATSRIINYLLSDPEDENLIYLGTFKQTK